ncbi:MAG: DUF4190 domain-containing protein [Polyangiaceae bacterium]|nr:DUF4190 domain-containing protein [Polyangiaceae bacterium]
MIDRPLGAAAGGWGPPPGGGAPGGFGPPGGFTPPGGGGPPAKPITGGPQTMALHAMTIEPATGLPRGEKPPATTSAVLSLVCGLLLCLGPVAGLTAIVAGLVARAAVRREPATNGGAGIALAGILLGVANLVGWSLLALGWALSALG